MHWDQQDMKNFINFLYIAVHSPQLLALVLCLSSGIKIYYIARLAPYNLRNHCTKPLFFLLLSIIGSLFGDLAWLVKLFHSLITPIPYFVVVFFIRIAWAFLIIQYQSLSLFIQSLSTKQFYFGYTNKLTSFIGALLSGYFFYLAFFQPYTLCTEAERNIARATGNSLEFFIMCSVAIYFLIAVVLIGLFFAYRVTKKSNLPKILGKQLRLFWLYFITPYFITEFVLMFSIKFVDEVYFIVSMATLLISCAIYYCLHNVLKLRFMNVNAQVQNPPQTHIIEDFKLVLERLSNTTSTQELLHITQSFFKEAFYLPLTAVDLVIRDYNPLPEKQSSPSKKTALTEQFLSQEQKSMSLCCTSHDSILNYDEIAFNHFYEETDASKTVLHFLNSIPAAVFLPIYSNKKIVAYITIDRNARSTCFSQSEQDAMIAFASYLGNIINLLHHKNINSLLYKEKKLKDSIYTKHQEINQYKESIHSFLRRSKQKILGIVFYKQGSFTWGNQDAKKLISVNLNQQDGHPITQAFRQVAQYVHNYKVPYSHYTKDDHGHPLILAGVPHLKQQSVIITVSYPDISDVIVQQMHQLHNPNDWDYLLYLSSTKAGQLIQELIPGSGELLLNFKINLLKAALSKKTLLLDMPNDDQLSIVKLVHTISLRETLHTIELTNPTVAGDIALRMFGDKVITQHAQPLLKKLNTGTLFIKNIHFLDKITQHYLAEYITYGFYRVFETDQKIPSNCHIICSTNQQISQLVQEETFSPELFSALKLSVISMPSLATIPLKELFGLIDSITDQLLTSHTAKNLFSLTDKEKQKIVERQPSSIHELKTHVQQLISKKSDESDLYDTATPLKNLDNPILSEAARLGKQALKNHNIMTTLWKKFKSQNKIALFLGVNRSSVNRRFKLFNIGKECKEIT